MKCSSGVCIIRENNVDNMNINRRFIKGKEGGRIGNVLMENSNKNLRGHLDVRGQSVRGHPVRGQPDNL